MTPDAAFQHPGDMAQFERGGDRKNVAVIGGGIAGLTAAYELLGQGHNVTLLEASGRLGGRILTERFGDRSGPYAELGAMRIPYGHRCVDHYVDEFVLTRQHFVSENHDAWFAFRGSRVPRREWRTAARQFGTDKELDLILKDLVSSTGWPPDHAMWGQAIGDWTRPALAQLESRSLGQLVDAAIRSRDISPEEWAWVHHARGFGWIDDASVLFWQNVGSLLDPVGRYQIAGGMARLVDEFESRLKEKQPPATLRLSSPVHRIDVGPQSVNIYYADKLKEFHYAILAIPAPCVARITFKPSLPPNQEQALRGIYYFPIAKSVALFDRRFWEADDGIAGGSSVTDLPNQQIWYPSDNARPLTDAESDHLQERIAILGRSALAPAPAEPSDWRARDPRISEGPGALIAGYMWGINAMRFASLNQASRDQVILESLLKVHPQAGHHRPRIVHRVWGEHPNPGGGGFAYFRPTEQQRFGQILCQPHLWEGRGHPRIFFAGEHDGIAQGWIQGAIQSALAAAASVLTAP